MKIYYPKDADGNIVGLRTPEKYVYDANGDSLSTKLANFLTASTLPKAASDTLGAIKVGSNLSVDANGVLSAKAAANYGVANNLTQAAAGSNVLDAYQGKLLNDAVTTLNSKAQPNRCILTDNYGTITSDFGYTYDDISAMLTNGDWDKYIHDLDYIKVKLSNGHWFTMRFNINTYLNYYSDQPNIDMISDELEYDYVYIWEEDYENNNGTNSIKIPLMRMPDIQAFLNTTLYNRIPSGLKSHIVDKIGYFPYRYTNGQTLTDDNGCTNGNLGKVWLPFEFEIFGRYDMSTPLNKTYGASYLKQYPCFQHGPYGKHYWDKADATASLSSGFDFWWTGSPYSGNTDYWVYVNYGGYAYGYDLDDSNRVPLCIRFR